MFSKEKEKIVMCFIEWVATIRLGLRKALQLSLKVLGIELIMKAQSNRNIEERPSYRSPTMIKGILL
jgi:hypothetical protein